MTQTLPPNLHQILTTLPKAELHVHLEGSVRPATFLTLARRHNLDVGILDEKSVIELFQFKGFRHFMQLYGECTYAFGAPEDFERVTEELGLDAAAQGIRYLEVTFTPGTHYRFKQMPFAEVMDAVANGAASARRQVGVEMRFILDHVRGFSLDDCYQTAEWCLEGRNQGVVALGLAGLEPGNPASLYAEAIKWVQEQGVAFVPHAGEAAGPESIWDALQFQPPRIGHGFRAIEDPTLVQHLHEHRTVLEICPTSNVCTGTVPDLNSHPLRQLWDAGLRITLNSDDPPMFNTSLLNEYYLAATRFGFTVEELAQISLTAVEGSLLSEPIRTKLRTEFLSKFSQMDVHV